MDREVCMPKLESLRTSARIINFTNEILNNISLPNLRTLYLNHSSPEPWMTREDLMHLFDGRSPFLSEVEFRNDFSDATFDTFIARNRINLGMAMARSRFLDTLVDTAFWPHILEHSPKALTACCHDGSNRVLAPMNHLLDPVTQSDSIFQLLKERSGAIFSSDQS